MSLYKDFFLSINFLTTYFICNNINIYTEYSFIKPKMLKMSIIRNHSKQIGCRLSPFQWALTSLSLGYFPLVFFCLNWQSPLHSCDLQGCDEICKTYYCSACTHSPAFLFFYCILYIFLERPWYPSMLFFLAIFYWGFIIINAPLIFIFQKI